MDPEDEEKKIKKDIAKKDSEIELLKKIGPTLTALQEKKSQKIDTNALANLDSQLNQI